jgi:hypothetical protein
MCENAALLLGMMKIPPFSGGNARFRLGWNTEPFIGAAVGDPRVTG